MITALISSLIIAPYKWSAVCIDPGHPSEVGRGTQGKKLTELHFAWLVAVDLKKQLENDGFLVVLTKKKENEVVTNRKRADIANASGAGLLLRLHCDAASNSGSTIYYPDRKGTAQGRTGPSDRVLAATALAAKPFYSAYSASLKGKLAMNGLHSDIRTAIGSKQGALTGSIFSEVPTLLVEMVVLTNPKDEAFALSKSGRSAIVAALRAGVRAVIPVSRSGAQTKG